MPNVRTVGNKPKTHADAPKPVVHASPIKPEQPAELIQSNTSSAQLAETAKGCNLPAFLQGTDNLPEVPDFQGTYIGFAHPQSKQWLYMMQAGLEEGEPFIKLPEGIVKLNPLKFFVLMGDSFKTLMVGREGKFKFVTRDMDHPEMREGATALQEHYPCLLIVDTPQGLIATKGDFRGPKSKGIKSAILAVKAASDPDWLKKSDAHKITAAFPQPFGRVFNTLTTERDIVKGGPNKGNPYHRAECDSRPSTVAEMEKLIKAFSDPEFVSSVEEAKKQYDARISFLDKIIEDGPQV